VQELQQDWSLADHKEHTRRIVDILNKEVEILKNKKAKKDAWKLKKFHVDESESWDQIPEERKPLAFYMQENVMIQKVMTMLFDEASLDKQWASNYPDQVSHFFITGGTQAANMLGVPRDYNWLNDPFARNEEAVTTDSKAPNGGGQSGGRRIYQRHLSDTSDEEQDIKLPKNIVRRPRKYQRVNQESGTTKKNPFVDDEAVEDNGGDDLFDSKTSLHNEGLYS
jgi:hypothetical protein